MSINFDRNRTQVLFENIVSVGSPIELADYKTAFKNYIISSEEAVALSGALLLDAVDFFYNGILSFAEGIDSIFAKKFSWATVKLYYSVYYLIRASLATKNIAILRYKGMYRLKAIEGEKPFTTGNKAYSTTHEGTIKHHKDLFALSDRLLSNDIDDMDAYAWMLAAREIVNYRSQTFKEPDCLDIWNEFSLSVDDNSLSELLKRLEDDPYIMCFQEEYSVVGIPIKRLKQTVSDMGLCGLLNELGPIRGAFARGAMGYDDHSLTILSEIFT